MHIKWNYNKYTVILHYICNADFCITTPKSSNTLQDSPRNPQLRWNANTVTLYIIFLIGLCHQRKDSTTSIFPPLSNCCTICTYIRWNVSYQIFNQSRSKIKIWRWVSPGLEKSYWHTAIPTLILVRQSL